MRFFRIAPPLWSVCALPAQLSEQLLKNAELRPMIERLIGGEMTPAEAERTRKEHDIKLSEWRSASNAVVPVTRVPRARFPVVNVHNHFAYEGDEAAVARAVQEMDAANIGTVAGSLPQPDG